MIAAQVFYDWSGGMESSAMLVVERDRIRGENNCKFAAHARADIPYLLDLLDKKDETIKQLREAEWIVTALRAPRDQQFVIVHGGIAQYRGGRFYTGMDEPAFMRPIHWEVTHWKPVYNSPPPALTPKEEENA